jgi:hydrophobic/amphiphilic exporter-1 (mainly G- bacteria), HAE1 family
VQPGAAHAHRRAVLRLHRDLRPAPVQALIGLLMLRSIVVTNAIVLLDLAQHKIEADADVRAVVMQGGRTHVRSSLKTAAATILALIPLAPSSDDGLIAAGLVAVVIGGLLSNTLLTLVVILVIDNLVVELCRGGAGGGDLLTPPRSPAR